MTTALVERSVFQEFGDFKQKGYPIAQFDFFLSTTCEDVRITQNKVNKKVFLNLQILGQLTETKSSHNASISLLLHGDRKAGEATTKRPQ